MKKIITILALGILVSISVSAQKGSVLLGGSLAFVTSTNNNTDTKQTGFTFSPTLGYQFNENWTAGIVSSIGSAKYETTTVANSAVKQNQFAVGPFIRYSMPLAGVFSCYGQLQGLFGSSTYTPSGANPVDQKSNTTTVSLTPAIAINLKNNFALNFSLGGLQYSSSKDDVAGAKSVNSFVLSFNSGIGIGVSKNFGGGKSGGKKK